jgi:demethylmenaquinone methyltransferase/2-methoxy-6-polyprenyl-1,4-benzoquinol methylase
VVTIAYGVRNFEDRAKGLGELRRILRADGTLLILEFSQPNAWFLPLHFIHVRCVLPVLAGLLTGDFGAYKYLGTSIAGFPDATGLDAELKAAGFAKVSHKRMLFGTVALHQAQA